MTAVCLLLPVLGLLATSQAFISHGFCSGSDLGTERVEEAWECDGGGGASCSQTTTTCSCGGESIEQGGTNNYDSRGQLQTATGPGWDCSNKCRGNPRTSGAQAKSSKKSCGGGGGSGFSGGSGGSTGNKMIFLPSAPDYYYCCLDCDYRCTSGGGCEVRYGGTLGSCFPHSFGGACSGTPAQCVDCKLKIRC